MIVDENDWYDSFGEFYMAIASSSKASALGQFFTPAPVVNFMVAITGDGTKGAGERMNDPASGSGRMLISYHAHYPGNYTFGADIDSICAKMTALNMVIHGCQGQAVCMNSLNADDWRFGYNINPYIRATGGLPHLVKIEKEQCFQWQYFQREKAKFFEKNLQENVEKIIAKTELVAVKFGQLSLF